MPYIPPASLEPQPLPLPLSVSIAHQDPAEPSSPRASESDESTISPSHSEQGAPLALEQKTSSSSSPTPSSSASLVLSPPLLSAEQRLIPLSEENLQQAQVEVETPRAAAPATADRRSMSAAASEPLPAGPSTAAAPMVTSPPAVAAGVAGDTPITSLSDAVAALDIVTATDPSSSSSLSSEPRRESHDSLASSTAASSSAMGAELSASSESVTSVESELDDLLSTPATSVAGPMLDGLDEAVVRYRHGLYAYTRSLYLEAKLSSKNTEKKRDLQAHNNFGLKQSGMERLAAKKALAKRLNA